jgi:signal transduction histidine kinase
VQVTDTSDGLAGMPTALDSRNSARDAADRLWFVTGRGLTILDPATAFLRPRASGPVHIESVFADDRRIDVSPDITLPAGTSRLRIDYSAVSLSAPEHTRFRYKLEGFDQDWHAAGTIRQAVYTNLPPRQYRFLLQGEPNDGELQTTSTGWAFRIAPRFYQTWSFYLLAAVTLALVATGAWQLRLRHVRRELEIVYNERARVGRELHDTLLQTMAGVALHVDDVAKNLVPRGTSAERQLLSVRQSIEDGIVEARQVIWRMRGSGERGDLPSALEAMAAQLTSGTPVRFRLSVAGAPRPVDDHVHQELMRIAQEAAANAVNHGRPSSVGIELRYDTASLALRVVDDGTGFDAPRRDATPHFGLVTMQERTQHLGGHFRLTSAVGTGTQVEAVIPL